MGPGSTILVVDDNAENRALARATLEDEGYVVSVARSGTEGIELFVRDQPACILLDVRMPGLDGVSACEQIRALPGGEDVAIVFVTAQREVETFDRALAVGGDDFLTKPFRPSELVVRVQAALRLRKLAGERTELFAEVKQQRDALQRLQLQKEQLASFLVHDLKNPVGAIELQAQRVLRDPAVTERSKSAANTIRDEARALMRMILNLLDLSRADEGQLSPSPQALDPVSTVRCVVEELHARAAASQVELATVVDATELHGDQDLVRRVLANLVDNALRYAPEGSTVTVIARPAEGGTELCVRDRGAGVPADKRADIFQRYTSGERPHHQNRGLGLAFCKLAIEAHGGTIWVEDAQPGAMFCARLPHVAP